MPGSVMIHAAVFAAGALLGGGIAAVVTSRKTEQLVPTRSSMVVSTPRPVLEVDAAGKAKVLDTAIALLPPVLKYGNPGNKLEMYFIWH